jgi:hypothetical protein
MIWWLLIVLIFCVTADAVVVQVLNYLSQKNGIGPK